MPAKLTIPEPNPSGLCQCGCAEPTRPSKQGDSRLGLVKDAPRRFLPGHQNRAKGPAWIEEDRGYKTPCHIWQRAKDRNGYGMVSSKVPSGWRYAHIVAWEEVNGPVPKGLKLDHLCRQPDCRNPEHLEAVTNKENCRRGKATKLTADIVREIRAATGATGNELATKYGVSRGQIYQVRAGRRWGDV